MTNKETKFFNAVIHMKTLELCRVAADKKNYNILRMLRTKDMTRIDIMKVLNIAKMPAYRRINMMKDCGLITIENGLVKRTKIADAFDSAVKEMRDKSIENFAKD